MRLPDSPPRDKEDTSYCACEFMEDESNPYHFTGTNVKFLDSLRIHRIYTYTLCTDKDLGVVSTIQWYRGYFQRGREDTPIRPPVELRSIPFRRT